MNDIDRKSTVHVGPEFQRGSQHLAGRNCQTSIRIGEYHLIDSNSLVEDSEASYKNCSSAAVKSRVDSRPLS